MKVADALSSVQRIGLDTAPLIYFVEQNPHYVTVVRAVFQQIDSGMITAVTSTLVLTEVLTKPLRDNDPILQTAYHDLLYKARNLEMFHITPIVAEQAAQLRATYNLKTPDALHIASALRASCDAFLTNDTGLKRVQELNIIIVDDLTI